MPIIDTVGFPQNRVAATERGAVLWRYAIVIAVAALACFLAFSTVGQQLVDRVWQLGEKIAQA